MSLDMGSARTSFSLKFQNVFSSKSPQNVWCLQHLKVDGFWNFRVTKLSDFLFEDRLHLSTSGMCKTLSITEFRISIGSIYKNVTHCWRSPAMKKCWQRYSNIIKGVYELLQSNDFFLNNFSEVSNRFISYQLADFCRGISQQPMALEVSFLNTLQSVNVKTCLKFSIPVNPPTNSFTFLSESKLFSFQDAVLTEVSRFGQRRTVTSFLHFLHLIFVSSTFLTC